MSIFFGGSEDAHCLTFMQGHITDHCISNNIWQWVLLIGAACSSARLTPHAQILYLLLTISFRLQGWFFFSYM